MSDRYASLQDTHARVALLLTSVHAVPSFYFLLISCRLHRSRTVFVGNIPYDATEEQLVDIFQEVGPVVSFRLVFDKETGKPKGYGFCEYRDAETAMSAMRNLNNYEMGGRTLRVDFADTKSQGGGAGTQQKRQAAAAAEPKPEPPRPAGDAGVTQAQISRIVESLPPAQLYNIISDAKAMINQNPEQLRHLLRNNPQLSYALLHAHLLLSNAVQQQQPAPQQTFPVATGVPYAADNMFTTINNDMMSGMNPAMALQHTQMPLQPIVPPNVPMPLQPLNTPLQTLPPMQPPIQNPGMPYQYGNPPPTQQMNVPILSTYNPNMM